VTAADRTLAKIRQLLPESWEERRSGPDANTRRLAEIRNALYPQATIRARIVALVEEHGALRAVQIRDMLKIPPGSLSGHLIALVAQDRLENPVTGVYILPGKRPAVLPPRPAGRISEAARNRRRPA
jgi:hypothetical protein